MKEVREEKIRKIPSREHNMCKGLMVGVGMVSRQTESKQRGLAETASGEQESR